MTELLLVLHEREAAERQQIFHGFTVSATMIHEVSESYEINNLSEERQVRITIVNIGQKGRVSVFQKGPSCQAQDFSDTDRAELQFFIEDFVKLRREFRSAVIIDLPERADITAGPPFQHCWCPAVDEVDQPLCFSNVTGVEEKKWMFTQILRS